MHSSEILNKIIYHRKSRSLLSSNNLSLYDFNNLKDAYRLQSDVCKNLDYRISGWKLGGTKNDEKSIVWGPVFESAMFFQNAEVSDNLLFGLEVELAVRLSDDFSLVEFQSVDKGQKYDFISDISLAIELPCSVYPFKLATKFHLLADLCASGYVVFSNPIPFERFNNSAFKFVVYCDDELIYVGNSAELFTDLEGIVGYFINELPSTNGRHVEAGQWIVTGALSPLIEVSSGQKITVESTLFDKTQVSFV